MKKMSAAGRASTAKLASSCALIDSGRRDPPEPGRPSAWVETAGRIGGGGGRLDREAAAALAEVAALTAAASPCVLCARASSAFPRWYSGACARIKTMLCIRRFGQGVPSGARGDSGHRGRHHGDGRKKMAVERSPTPREAGPRSAAWRRAAVWRRPTESTATAVSLSVEPVGGPALPLVWRASWWVAARSAKKATITALPSDPRVLWPPNEPVPSTSGSRLACGAAGGVTGTSAPSSSPPAVRRPLPASAIPSLS